MVHIALIVAGRFRPFDFPGATATSARAIDLHSRIVGVWLDDESVSHGFLKTQRRFESIDFPGASASSAYGINLRGVIVGFYANADGAAHGFLRLPEGEENDD
jgi:hypothetical protein